MFSAANKFHSQKWQDRIFAFCPLRLSCPAVRLAWLFWMPFLVSGQNALLAGMNKVRTQAWRDCTANQIWIENISLSYLSVHHGGWSGLFLRPQTLLSSSCLARIHLLHHNSYFSMQSTEKQRNYSIALRQINANIYFMSNYRGTEAVQRSSYESKRPLRNGRTETVLEVHPAG